MKRITMLVGVSGSGKSRYIAQQGIKKEAVFSSDAIRKELFGTLNCQNGESHQKVFGTLLGRILRYSEDCIYDATNLTRKTRATFRSSLKNDKLDVILFIEPFIKLYANNEAKPLDERVPFTVLENMYKNIQIPRVGVDCENFSIFGQIPFFAKATSYNQLAKIDTLENFLNLVSDEYRYEMKNLFTSHDSKYHSENINEHINLCIKNVDTIIANEEIKDMLRIVAIFHDLGKAFCKDKGVYIGHNQVSAMYAAKAFSEINDMKNSEILLETIYQHMNYHNGMSEKTILKNSLDDKTLGIIAIFGSIDDMSRVKIEGGVEE